MRYRTTARPLMLLTALIGVGLAGCSDDDGPTGPVTPFDQDATAQAVAEMEDRLDGDSDVMMSLALVSPAIEAEGGMLPQLIPAGVTRPAQPFNAQLMIDPSFSMEPIFPSNFLGKTFEWDEGLGRYAMTDRVGAPTNGVRFILYAGAEPLHTIRYFTHVNENNPHIVEGRGVAGVVVEYGLKGITCLLESAPLKLEGSQVEKNVRFAV